MPCPSPGLWHPESAILTVLTARCLRILATSTVTVPKSKWTSAPKASFTVRVDPGWPEAGGGSRQQPALPHLGQCSEDSLHRCSLCPVFDVDSYVRQSGPLWTHRSLIATELPLDKICGLKLLELLTFP